MRRDHRFGPRRPWKGGRRPPGGHRRLTRLAGRSALPAAAWRLALLRLGKLPDAQPGGPGAGGLAGVVRQQRDWPARQHLGRQDPVDDLVIVDRQPDVAKGVEHQLNGDGTARYPAIAQGREILRGQLGRPGR